MKKVSLAVMVCAIVMSFGSCGAVEINKMEAETVKAAVIDRVTEPAADTPADSVNEITVSQPDSAAETTAAAPEAPAANAETGTKPAEETPADQNAPQIPQPVLQSPAQPAAVQTQPAHNEPTEQIIITNAQTQQREIVPDSDEEAPAGSDAEEDIPDNRQPAAEQQPVSEALPQVSGQGSCVNGLVNITAYGDPNTQTITLDITNNIDNSMKLFGIPTLVVDGYAVQLDPFANMNVPAQEIPAGVKGKITLNVPAEQIKSGTEIAGKIHSMSFQAIGSDTGFNITLD